MCMYCEHNFSNLDEAFVDTIIKMNNRLASCKTKELASEYRELKSVCKKVLAIFDSTDELNCWPGMFPFEILDSLDVGERESLLEGIKDFARSMVDFRNSNDDALSDDFREYIQEVIELDMKITFKYFKISSKKIFEKALIELFNQYNFYASQLGDMCECDKKFIEKIISVINKAKCAYETVNKKTPVKQKISSMINALSEEELLTFTFDALQDGLIYGPSNEQIERDCLEFFNYGAALFQLFLEVASNIPSRFIAHKCEKSA